MIRYNKIGVTFTVRSAGILIENDQVLVHKLLNDDYWTLPGGRIDINETTEEAVVREFDEELGALIETERLIYVVEGFFTNANKQFHELSFIYKVRDINQNISQFDFETREGLKHYKFKWINLNELSTINLQPKFLVKEIHGLPQSITHKYFEM
jgi:8-oxo-dGTP pyrophosphatase MutT (NUDIX family)